jgi:hypothetical protein
VGSQTWAALKGGGAVPKSKGGSTKCGGGDKYAQTLEQVFGSEGLCQNLASDSGSLFMTVEVLSYLKAIITTARLVILAWE